MNGIVDIELLTSIEFFHPLDAVALNPAVDLFFVIQGQGNVVSVYSFKSTLIWSQSIPCTEAKWSTDGGVLIVSCNDGTAKLLHRDTGDLLGEVEETVFDARIIRREAYAIIFNKQEDTLWISSAHNPTVPIISFQCTLRNPISAVWTDPEHITIYSDETIEIFLIDPQILQSIKTSKYVAYKEELKFLLRSFGNIFEEIKSQMQLVEKAFCQVDLEALQSVSVALKDFDARNANTRLYSRLKPMVDRLQASLKDGNTQKALYLGLLAALQRLEDDWIDMLALLKLLQDDHSSIESFYEIATATWLAKWLIFFAHPEYTQAKYLQSLAQKVDNTQIQTSKTSEVMVSPIASLPSPGHIDSIFPTSDSSIYAVCDNRKPHRIDCLNLKVNPVYIESSENDWVLPASSDSYLEVVKNIIYVRNSTSQVLRFELSYEPEAISYSFTKQSLLTLTPYATSIVLYRVIHE